MPTQSSNLTPCWRPSGSLISPIAACISSPARTARSVSSPCATGAVQIRAPAVAFAPHAGQRRSSGAPQAMQKCACAGFSAEHAAHWAISAQLLDVHPRDRSGDDELLDLRGSLEDVVDLRVAVPALDWELARVAVAAEDLDRTLGHPHRDLARLELRHRALGVFEGMAVAPHPRRAPHEQARGVDLELHARERSRDRLGPD